MPYIDQHRRATSEEMEIFLLKPPFSCFDFIENRFGDYDSIRRVFSLARSTNAQALILETIPPQGIILEENEDILDLYPTYSNDGLLRISFWKKPVNRADIASLTNKDLIGYTVIKNDLIKETGSAHWHIFEAVFSKYPHDHNCVPRPKTYHLTVGSCSFEIKGLLFCQQNSLNKACAQVALRSLLSRILPDGDISYRRINELANTVMPGFNPGQGLSVPQIREILTVLGFKFNDVDYSNFDEQQKKELPYQKYAYAGLESGDGALVGFRLAGRELQEEAKHIIPIYGHTFNKDTWAPNADVSYFRIGEGVGYVPSESWTSSFLGHDDNFGPNFCIPRLYIENDKVDYVVEIFRPGILFGGLQSEAIALDLLYSILPNLTSSDNKWVLRLAEWTLRQQVVFRAQALSSTEYVKHLRKLRDWEGNKEDSELCKLFWQELPDYVWAVEISTPQLFPANKRKLGEIVLDATHGLTYEEESAGNEVFIFARLPGIYLFGGKVNNGSLGFTPVPSEIQSHTGLIKF